MLTVIKNISIVCIIFYLSKAEYKIVNSYSFLFSKYVYFTINPQIGKVFAKLKNQTKLLKGYRIIQLEAVVEWQTEYLEMEILHENKTGVSGQQPAIANIKHIICKKYSPYISPRKTILFLLQKHQLNLDQKS